MCTNNRALEIYKTKTEIKTYVHTKIVYEHLQSSIHNQQKL